MLIFSKESKLKWINAIGMSIIRSNYKKKKIHAVSKKKCGAQIDVTWGYSVLFGSHLKKNPAKTFFYTWSEVYNKQNIMLSIILVAIATLKVFSINSLLIWGLLPIIIPIAPNTIDHIDSHIFFLYSLSLI